MTSLRTTIKASFGALLLAAIALPASVSAHVVVKPAEVVTAGFQTFTIGVPNEKEVPTTKVRLDIPKGLNYVSPTKKQGWTISTEKSGSGEDATVTSITWENGTVEEGFREEFTFSAQVPAKATDLQWKAYQTYANGTVVAWDKADDKQKIENSGPFSVTKVVAQTEAETLLKNAEARADSAKSNADTALYVAIFSLLAAGAGIYLTTRNKR